MSDKTPKFQFSNGVVVDGNQVGVIVKTWGASRNRGIHYEVYVRSYNRIDEYDECDIKHLVHDKEIQKCAFCGLENKKTCKVYKNKSAG